MTGIRQPIPPISAVFPDIQSAHAAAARLRQGGIVGEQISIVEESSTVLSAANDPAIYKATGEEPEAGSIETSGQQPFAVHSEKEHMEHRGRAVVTVQPEAGQEARILEILRSGVGEVRTPAA